MFPHCDALVAKATKLAVCRVPVPEMLAGAGWVVLRMARQDERDKERIRTGVRDARGKKGSRISKIPRGDCGVLGACEQLSHRNVVKKSTVRAAPEERLWAT